MQPDIVEFWNRCPLEDPPFVHPDDREEISRRAPGALEEPINNYEGFVQSKRFGDFDDYDFHLSLLPAPYVGDLVRAKIFLLMLNPGFNMADYYAEYRVRAFRRRAIANLHQSFEGVQFPFMFLDPDFSWHSGFRYWESKLRPIAQKIVEHRRVRYSEAMGELSRSLAVLQMVPYHSASLKDGWALRLPSAKEVKKFAHEQVYRRAKTGEAIAIILRSVGQWKLKKCRNIVHYKSTLARGASLGLKTPGGEAILRSLCLTGP
jgi:hypothetical protein